MAFIEGQAGGDVMPIAGAPVAGTDQIQTLTIGGTPTGGTFQLSYDGAVTAAIPWNATNATFLASIDAALEALRNVGVNNLTTAAGTLTAGIGTVLLTFTGPLGKKALSTITVAANNLTGTSPTVAVATTTPGVDASFRGAAIGTLIVDSTVGKLYINTGTAQAPTWTVVGAQS